MCFTKICFISRLFYHHVPSIKIWIKIHCYNLSVCFLPHFSFSQDGGGKYKARHQVLTSTATVTINVLDAQDMPPSFIGTPYFGYVYEVSVPVSPPLIGLMLLLIFFLHTVNMYKMNYIFFFFQGSEIFTVYAKDGDQGNPNPIHYSIMNGKNNTSIHQYKVELSYLLFSAFLSDTFATFHLSPFR